jgi:rubrerythrin
MSTQLTMIEILGLAIRSEEDAAKFYGDLARRIKNGLARAKYEALAREEVSHRQLLQNLYRRATGESAPPHIPGSPEVAEGGGIPVETEEIEELLKIAIGREERARDFYRTHAPRMGDVGSRRLLEYLADIERGHELMLREELAAYLRDRNWYAEKPDIQLIG